MKVANDIHRNVRCNNTMVTVIDELTMDLRNQELIPSSGSSLHLPPIALLPNDRRGLGIGIR